jgi:hypothetical protein
MIAGRDERIVIYVLQVNNIFEGHAGIKEKKGYYKISLRVE